MEILINTPGQTFYYSSIEELIHHCEKKDKCAIILYHADAEDFIDKMKDKFGSCISQLIVVGDNIDDIIEKSKDINVFIIMATNTQDAIQIALNSAAMCKDVICVSKSESSKSFTDMVELVIT